MTLTFFSCAAVLGLCGVCGSMSKTGADSAPAAAPHIDQPKFVAQLKSNVLDFWAAHDDYKLAQQQFFLTATSVQGQVGNSAASGAGEEVLLGVWFRQGEAGAD